ncbi:hypothetical protein MYSTI_00971 [Myxococcus stipitatus DSM 14675]|uniref:Tetratricopeptide repeat protein n=1 Tax=Myxococcus stipitatus (strain DSM 14675 / JCM 12634 / Mx s8) TaxID=1278073 RepID=L7U390_MYXSD|nr:hypothetical protein MYSTI_00971 [Myxococcus stipitatus DSM 14675]
MPSRALGEEGEAQREIAEAIQLYEHLDYERALDRLHRASRLPHGPADAVTLSMIRGIIQADMGRWESARKDFRQALQSQVDAQLPLRVSPKVKREFEMQRAKVRGRLAKPPRDSPVVPPPASVDTHPVSPAPDSAVARPQLAPPVTETATPKPWVPDSVDEEARRASKGFHLAGRRVPLVSWILLGGGLAAGGTGVVIGASSRGQSERARDSLLRTDSEHHYARAQSSVRTANILFGTATAAVVGALGTWFFMGTPAENTLAEGSAR